jgi:hypothetical protein
MMAARKSQLASAGRGMAERQLVPYVELPGRVG